ncbi:PASTA domain-containing protein [Ruminococcus sp.]|uniref:PASTA domain-containing protein n=1 Tax=Ruminococcus sp. TaxID=41978 RepID=UPI0025EAEE01|nr:PASTA domain-containing protein [Ruminococcus sp.]MCI6616779.1 PASTA domain-containing protein [Ruminococcus sp.]
MSLCMGCMQEIGNNKICPECGFNNSEKQHAPFLPYGTVLSNRYIIGSGIDTNGESTRYISFDKQTGDVVIICEFLPMGLFNREEGSTEIKINYENRLAYNKLKDEFISYYRILCELRDLSALMKVHNIFEENNTVYVVEENEDLIPFEEYVERSNGSLEWDIARPLFMPVISALEALHKRGVGHYAIAPKNIFVTSSGKIKISGFATENERKRGTPLKSQLFSGAAAPEQYDDNFPLDDITDIYGFCSTLFYALTGHLPKSAPERRKDSRLLMSTTTVKRLPPHVVSALANGLQVERENRITDFDELRSQLSVAHTAKAIQEEISRTASMNLSKSDKSQKGRNGMSHTSIVIISAAITVLVLGIAGVFWLMQNPLAGVFGGNTSETVESTQSTEWTGATIPNYVGMNYEDVMKQAEGDTKITVYRSYTDEYSDQYKEGTVMSQNPPAGSKVTQEDGILISITVSKGPQMRELPKIEGLKLDEAASDIAEQGLLATAEYQYSNTVAEDRVIGYKSHQEGDTVEYGTNVTIIVSKGKETEETQSNQ